MKIRLFWILRVPAGVRSGTGIRVRAIYVVTPTGTAIDRADKHSALG